MPTLIDLTGRVFGRLTVLSRAEDYICKNGRHRARWNCLCSCGVNICVLGESLRQGNTHSCGCLFKEMMSCKQKTHGDSKKALYGIWSSMKARCFNKNTDAYKDYGHRGISVCDEWANNYESFKLWSENNGYEKGLTLDRIDNSGNYCPSNCRWTDRKKQANNRRSNRRYTIDGETHNLTEWANIYGINPKTLFSRIYSGVDIETALQY